MWNDFLYSVFVSFAIVNHTEGILGISLCLKISDKEGVMNPQHRMIPYPLPSDSQEETESNKRRGSNYKFPIDIALTQFHLTMVFYDRIRIICTVNQQLVFEDSNDQVISH